MATEHVNQTPDQSTGFRSELEEPRRTTDHNVDQQENLNFPTSGGGYGGVSEEEPPHHKIHTDDEPLPKPRGGTYNLDEGGAKGFQDASDEGAMPPGKEASTFAEESPRGEQLGAGNEGVNEGLDRPGSDQFGGEKTPVVEPKSFGSGRGEEPASGGYADPSAAFAGAPVDKKVEETGYGYDQKASEPTFDESAAVEHGTEHSAKKEGFMTKLKEKLPGHHKAADHTGLEHESAAPVEHDSPTSAHKKGLMTKIKEKLPGHHATPAAE